MASFAGALVCYIFVNGRRKHTNLPWESKLKAAVYRINHIYAHPHAGIYNYVRKYVRKYTFVITYTDSLEEFNSVKNP